MNGVARSAAFVRLHIVSNKQYSGVIQQIAVTVEIVLPALFVLHNNSFAAPAQHGMVTRLLLVCPFSFLSGKGNDTMLLHFWIQFHERQHNFAYPHIHTQRTADIKVRHALTL